MGFTISRVTTDACTKLAAKLTLVETRIADPMPALEAIAKAFGEMEQERFDSGGTSSTYGVTESWAPLSDKTIANRASEGAGGSDPLVAFGYLEQAATHPNLRPFGTKSLELTIDVMSRASGQSVPDNRPYTRGFDYGLAQQQSERSFVTITPEFRIIARDIMAEYIDPNGINTAGAAFGNR
jgi:hypothetical protein